MTSTIEDVAGRVIQQAAPEYEQDLRSVSGGFFASEQIRGRVVDSVLTGGGGAAPSGVDAVSGALVVQVVLVLLQAIATDTASDFIRGGVKSFWQRRKIRRAGRGVARTTAVPQVSSTDALKLSERVRELIIASGGTAETAGAVAIAFAAAVSADARQLRGEADQG